MCKHKLANHEWVISARELQIIIRAMVAAVVCYLKVAAAAELFLEFRDMKKTGHKRTTLVPKPLSQIWKSESFIRLA